MKLLQDILYKAGIEDVVGSTHIAIEHLCFDSRNVEKFSAFVAIRGVQVDGHAYIDQAIESGALAVVCEAFPETFREKVTYVKVANGQRALGQMATNFYDNPSEELELIGVTGTNGKTTTVTLLYELFEALGKKTGLLSTVRNRIHRQTIAATHTTPDALQLNQLLREMVDQGCQYCFMEVSSHAIHQDRIAGLHFRGGVFTNITHDHLDYHKSFDEYIKAKKKFFDEIGSGAFALVNRDDFHSEVMVQNTTAKVKTYALKTLADFKGRILENQFSGLQLNIDGSEVWTKLIGGFNAYNVLAAYSVAVLLDKDGMDVLTEISNLSNVEGRFQYVKNDRNVIGIVDYAHTPDALKNVLSTIEDIRTGNEKVITVVGCGGNRDKEKRPVMAKIACQLSNQVILTSDNPRSEAPEAIIADMQKGVEPADYKKTLAVTDRKEAIKVASAMAGNGDIILVAGKGHEKYQEIKGERFDFDDLEVLREMLNMVNG